MKCDKRQECSICGGSFKMTRGCELEKRCPACRILVKHKTREFDKQYPLTSSVVYWAYYTRPDAERTQKIIGDVQFISDEEAELTPADDDLCESLCQEETRREIERVISEHLTRGEAIALRENLGLVPGDIEYSLREIAEHLNVSSERARQLIMSGLKKLKTNFRAKNLLRKMWRGEV